MCACVLCVDSACGRSEEGTGSPRTGATEDCELPCGGWELNWGPKPEQADIELPPNFNDPSSRWVMWRLERRHVSLINVVLYSQKVNGSHEFRTLNYD